MCILILFIKVVDILLEISVLKMGATKVARDIFCTKIILSLPSVDIPAFSHVVSGQSHMQNQHM